MDSYTICVWVRGVEYTLSGTLPELQSQLADLEYDGASIQVCDEAGFTRGRVSAEHWAVA